MGSFLGMFPQNSNLNRDFSADTPIPFHQSIQTTHANAVPQNASPIDTPCAKEAKMSRINLLLDFGFLYLTFIRPIFMNRKGAVPNFVSLTSYRMFHSTTIKCWTRNNTEMDYPTGLQ